MKVVTVDEMRALEQASEAAGVSTHQLMENAGLAVAEQARATLGDVRGVGITVLVGPGNNGGDGLVAARHLADWGAWVTLYLCARRSETEPNYRLALERNAQALSMDTDAPGAGLQRALASSRMVIDAVFGTGAVRPFQGNLQRTMLLVQQALASRPDLVILAVDLPSGLNADTGAVDPATLVADVTVCLGYPKVGMFEFPGAERIGRLEVVDIGIPAKAAESVHREIITQEWAAAHAPSRPMNAHKGTFGKAMIVAGSINYIGAAALACAAASRVGAGLVTLATPESLVPVFGARLTETTYLPLKEAEPGVLHPEAADQLCEALDGYSAVLIGCGLGQRPQVAEFVRRFLLSPSKGLALPTVIDADGLNNLAKVKDWWTHMRAEAVLTPHPGEMARLLDVPMEQVRAGRFALAQEQAKTWRKHVVLKGAFTAIASPEGELRISPVANPALATAGTGDVLAGAIAGLMAQGMTPYDAATLGVYVHGRAGERVRERLGVTGVVASDLLPELPLVFKELAEGIAAGPSRSE